MFRTYITTSKHHNMTALVHHNITTSQHDSITTSQHDNMTTSQHYNMTTSQHHITTSRYDQKHTFFSPLLLLLVSTGCTRCQRNELCRVLKQSVFLRVSAPHIRLQQVNCLITLERLMSCNSLFQIYSRGK